jgi:hypothetical protein
MTPADVLREVARWPRDLADDWEERSAIKEFSGNLPRAEAERQAYEELKHRVPLKTQGKLF